jgi:mono/diheme cytochrome c family protein/cytochrome c553
MKYSYLTNAFEWTRYPALRALVVDHCRPTVVAIPLRGPDLKALKTILNTLALILGLLATVSAPSAAQSGNSSEFFETRVRPLLAQKCFTCHTQARLGGLQIDSRESLLKGGNSGPAIVPGNPEQSLLIQAVSHTHERLKMPPQERLKEAEIAALSDWIRRGAFWPEAVPGSTTATQATGAITAQQRSFWSLQPVRKPALPEVKDRSWPKSPMDRFVLAPLEAQGLKPVRAADKRTWIRRVTFDLTGLPPTPEEVEAFAKDGAAKARVKVIDRLLASPRYGERWGRHWLDVARYTDDSGNTLRDDPFPNAYRYRDWVIQAFNEDVSYDQFVKAQIAGDFLEENRAKWVAGLGLYNLTPGLQDDRVDVTTRGFLGLTAGCAQCHDHKFDPIPTTDYYALQGVFESTELHEYPLSPEEVVEKYQRQKKLVDEQEAAIDEFLDNQSTQLAEILAARASRYLLATRKVMASENPDVEAAARQENLDRETLQRWVKHLKASPREHPFLNRWDELIKSGAGEADFTSEAGRFQELLLSVFREKKQVDQKNLILTGGSQEFEVLSKVNLASLERDRYVLWSDFFLMGQRTEGIGARESGVLRYRKKEVARFLQGEWKTHLESMQARLEELKRALPEKYPFLRTIKDAAKPANMKVYIRGNKETPGDEAPRAFLSVLCDGSPVPFSNGSGRLELAEAIASPQNPLTARVMVNRLWQHHFGAGLVATASNFGQLGERPSHPELLDYLAARFVEQGWSIKAMHREIVLSATYALSAESSPQNSAADATNRLLWRANRRKLDVEALRDSLLFVSGKLDFSMGGEPMRLTDEKNLRRTVYGFVSRAKLDGTLSLFDFPDPNFTSEGRITTDTPLQRLYFLNSEFVINQAKALASRLEKRHPASAEMRIREAYRLLFQRVPVPAEVQAGLKFLESGPNKWPQYAQALMSSSEFVLVN